MGAYSKIFPINRLKDECQKDFQVKKIVQGQDWHYLTELPVHRDDCYLFILLSHGNGTMNVDFQEICLHELDLCIVRPGQIHYNIKGENVSGWIVRVDEICISDDCLKVFEDVLWQSNTFSISENLRNDCFFILQMLDKRMANNFTLPLQNKISLSLLNTFLCYVASICVANFQSSFVHTSRQNQICFAFKKLLAENVIQSKSPSFYAEQLCISESYLNEVVKQTTGFNVSYWIRDRVILEAKRLLSFTDKTIQQVAYSLGYDDHVYFTKLFKRNTGVTPSIFRNDYHKECSENVSNQ